ncbi:hypothetical protein ACET3Z_008115 [Daucus carota]
MPQILRMIRIPRGEEQTLEPIAEKTPFLPPVIPTPAVPCAPSPSIRPSWVQRSVSAVRDFPPGCGSRASSVRPLVPYAPSLEVLERPYYIASVAVLLQPDVGVAYNISWASENGTSWCEYEMLKYSSTLLLMPNSKHLLQLLAGSR